MTLNPDKDEFILTPCIYREREYAALDKKELLKRKAAEEKKVSETKKEEAA